MRSLGLDIGGANLKATSLECSENKIEDVNFFNKYIAYDEWKGNNLKSQIGKLFEKERFDKIGVTMTSPLMYRHMDKGVITTLSAVKDITSNFYVLNNRGDFVDPDQALLNPLEMALSNTAATAKLISQFHENAILLDVGSTSTQIVPIIDGKIEVDAEYPCYGVVTGECLYLGVVRTPVGAIINKIPFRGNEVRLVIDDICSRVGELYYLLGKIPLEKVIITKKIPSMDLQNDEETIKFRMARLLMLDENMLEEEEFYNIAQAVYEEHVDITKEYVERIVKKNDLSLDECPCVIMGTGKFLAKDAAERAGFKNILGFGDLFEHNIKMNLETSFAVAYLVKEI